MNAPLAGKRLPFSENALPRLTATHLRHRPLRGVPRLERRLVAVRAESGRKSSFSAGFVVGGVICGVLGFLYAPQISKALLDEQQRLKVPQFLKDRNPRPVTKEEVIGRLDELHEALDSLSNDLGVTKPDAKETATANGHAEGAAAVKETPVTEPNT